MAERQRGPAPQQGNGPSDDDQPPTTDLSQLSLAQWAAVYAGQGWPIFPCWWLRHDQASSHVMPDGFAHVSVPCACMKGPVCPSPGKHPRCRHGAKEATSYLPMITAWWDMWPDAHIAVSTGMAGLVVIDVDPRNGGDESLRQLEADHGPLPVTLRAKTGGGGDHWVYLGGDQQIPTLPNWRPGIDVKASGNSHVILAPSMHSSGGQYSWLDLREIAPLPPELAQMIRSGPVGRSTGAGGPGASLRRSALPETEVFLARGFRDGSRDDDAIRLARRLFGEHGDSAYVRDVIMRVWRVTSQEPAPFTLDEVDKCIKQAERYWRAEYEKNLRLAKSLFGRGC